MFQHRRQERRESEIQADFAFLSTRGEVLREQRERAVKILVMTKTFSGALGFVVCGEDQG